MNSNNFSNSEEILKRNQLEVLKSLSLLLVREITSLEETQMTLEMEIENEKPIRLLEELQRYEAKLIRCALIRSMGKQRTAAKLLGLKETTLNTKIKRYRINLTELI